MSELRYDVPLVEFIQQAGALEESWQQTLRWAHQEQEHFRQLAYLHRAQAELIERPQPSLISVLRAAQVASPLGLFAVASHIQQWVAKEKALL